MVVLDIEGTTTPIAFVYEQLFPFARAHLRAFLAGDPASEDTRDIVRRLRAEWLAEPRGSDPPPPWSDNAAEDPSASVPYIEWLMDRDRKSPALKDLQGRIWRQGYETGTLTGMVFDDVLPALRRWRASGIKIAIYSSGSVLAQRLLFGHTAHGDLTSFLDAFFDPAVGPKTEADSYRRIAIALGHQTKDVLFISDASREVAAAREAGLKVLLCARPGNPPVDPASAGAPIVRSFDDV